MGNSVEKKIYCEECSKMYGELGVLRVYNNNYSGGHFFCVYCYPNIKPYSGYSNICSKKACCEFCGYKSQSSTESVFKVYWFGKYGGRFMCEKCLYNKDYRKTYK